jgi:hypothetical protein
MLKAERVPADYFTLKPTGEREVFQIAFATSPGYLYRFKVGVQYTYRGDEHVIWTDEEFEAAGYPPKADVWYVDIFAKTQRTLGITRNIQGRLVCRWWMCRPCDGQQNKAYHCRKRNYRTMKPILSPRRVDQRNEATSYEAKATSMRRSSSRPRSGGPCLLGTIGPLPLSE